MMNSKKTILIVEDSVTNLTVMSEYLSFKGFQVETAANGLEGLEQARKLRPDVIIMDIQMPVMDGLEAISIIRKIEFLSKTPIIVLTGSTTEYSKERIEELEINDYFTKPVSLAKMSKKILSYF